MNIQISNVAIRQNDNQFFNLNDLHKASGGNDEHRPTFWLRNKQTQELIAEIEAEGGKAVNVINGGKNRGTFVCKELVYAYATWISAKFFLLVIRTFDAAVNGKLSSSLKTKTALPNGLTLEQQDEVKAMHRAILENTPAEIRKAMAIKLWASVKQKFGCTYKAVSPEHFPEILSLFGRIAVENGIETLHGEVLDAPKPSCGIVLSDEEITKFATTTYYLTWATQQLKDLSAGLRMIGADKQGARAWTLWHETQIWLRDCQHILEANLPKIQSDYYKHHVQDSLYKISKVAQGY